MMILACTVLIQVMIKRYGSRVWRTDGLTDRQTDRRPGHF